MIKIDKSGRQKIHTRKIDISIYEGDSDSIILEGILRDERLLDSYQSLRGFWIRQIPVYSQKISFFGHYIESQKPIKEFR